MNLTKELSKQLGELISKVCVTCNDYFCFSVLTSYSFMLHFASIPNFREQCKESLKATKDQLSKLPTPPSDQPVADLLRMVMAFQADVKSLVMGADNFEQLLQGCKPAYNKFDEDVCGTFPHLYPFVDKDEMIRQMGGSDFVWFLKDVDHKPQNCSTPESETMFLADVREHIEK